MGVWARLGAKVPDSHPVHIGMCSRGSDMTARILVVDDQPNITRP